MGPVVEALRTEYLCRARAEAGGLGFGETESSGSARMSLCLPAPEGIKGYLYSLWGRGQRAGVGQEAADFPG